MGTTTKKVFSTLAHHFLLPLPDQQVPTREMVELPIGVNVIATCRNRVGKPAASPILFQISDNGKPSHQKPKPTKSSKTCDKVSSGSETGNGACIKY